MTRSAGTLCIGAAAALEVPTGLVLLSDPLLFSRLIFGADMAAAGQALGRMTGFALIALAIAVWPRRERDEGRLPATRALFLFSACAAAYLFWLGSRGQSVGILLWPAAATHFAFAILLAWTWFKRSGHYGPETSDGGS